MPNQRRQNNHCDEVESDPAGFSCFPVSWERNSVIIIGTIVGNTRRFYLKRYQSEYPLLEKGYNESINQTLSKSQKSTELVIPIFILYAGCKGGNGLIRGATMM